MFEKFEVFKYVAKEVRVAFKETQGDKMEPWFNLKDLCDVLGLKSVYWLAKRIRANHTILIETVVKTGVRHDGSTYEQRANSIYVDETGLYVCVLRSKKREAQDFLYYVCEEVLPELRKTGGYFVGMENLKGEEKEAAEAELRELREKYGELKADYDVVDREFGELFNKVKADFGLDYIYGIKNREGSEWVVTNEGLVVRKDSLVG